MSLFVAVPSETALEQYAQRPHRFRPNHRNYYLYDNSNWMVVVSYSIPPPIGSDSYDALWTEQYGVSNLVQCPLKMPLVI